MNLILFPRQEERYRVALDSATGEHLRRILLPGGNGRVMVGVEGGPRGFAVAEKGRTHYELRMVGWEKSPPETQRNNLNWLLSYCRPHTGKRLLSLAAELGIARLFLYPGEKSERGYGRSQLWSAEGSHPFLVRGAEQAFATHLPEVRRFSGLSAALDAARDLGEGVAFDPYEADGAATALLPFAPERPLTLAFGGERGWSGPEREGLRCAGFRMAHLGGRIWSLLTALTIATTLAGREQFLWCDAGACALQVES